MSAPVLTELSNAAFPGLAVGDPLGDGNFARSARRGALRERPDPRAGHGFVHRPARHRSDASRGLGCSGRLVRVRHERLQPERRGTSTMTRLRPRVTPPRALRWRSGRSTQWTTASAAARSVRSRGSIGGTNPDARVRSTRHARAARTCRTASSTRATRRCRPPGSTSTWRAPSVRSPRLTSTCSTAATGPALLRRCSRTTRTTCTRRSTRRTSRPTSQHPQTVVWRHRAAREQLPGLPGNDAGLYHFWDLLNATSRNGVNTCHDVGGTGQFGTGLVHPAADRHRLGDRVHGRARRGDPAVPAGRRRCADAGLERPLRPR